MHAGIVSVNSNQEHKIKLVSKLVVWITKKQVQARMSLWHSGNIELWRSNYNETDTLSTVLSGWDCWNERVFDVGSLQVISPKILLRESVSDSKSSGWRLRHWTWSSGLLKQIARDSQEVHDQIKSLSTFRVSSGRWPKRTAGTDNFLEEDKIGSLNDCAEACLRHEPR